jgi:hypothetical protein
MKTGGENWWKNTGSRKRKYSEENLLQCHFAHRSERAETWHGEI